MKVLIITVAGMASRFNQDLEKETLKCIYTEKSLKESLLYQIMTKCKQMDKYIIVGGYLFDELEKIVMGAEEFETFREKVSLVKNIQYKDYGSGYSLYLGLLEALKYIPTEIVFAEGDLFVDCDSLKKVIDSPKNVLTITREPILARKAVALYEDMLNQIHYLYDIQHECLQINEPFRAVYNSGQIWKFIDMDLLQKILNNLTEQDKKDTNLVIVQAYFGQLKRQEIDVIDIEKWFNCNTVDDYKLAFKK